MLYGVFFRAARRICPCSPAGAPCST